MAPDIFKFWSRLAPGDHHHPDDRAVFNRMPGHEFDLNLLPGCFMGRLRSAPIVLLFLSPGKSEEDKPSPGLADWHARTRTGNEPLVSRSVHPAAYKWWTERTAWLGPPEELVDKVAVLNIGAYHSKNVTNYGVLAALPSSRMSLDWAQSVLFPDAEKGERVVICLRAARYWGLEPGRRNYPGTLFAPLVTRGGHVHKSERRDIVDTVRRVLR